MMRLFWSATIAFLFGYLIAFAAHAEPAFCAPARAAAITCLARADCPGTQVCSRDFNPQIAYKWAQGHCYDPNGFVSAQPAIQADMCDLPDVVTYSAGNKYNLAGGSKILVPPPGITVFKKTILDGNGALLVAPNTAPPYVVLRFTVPLDGEFVYPAPGTHAAWSAVRDIAITPDVVSVTQNQITGLQIAAHGVRLDNIQIARLGRCLEVYGVAGHANADDVQGAKITVNGCWGYGVYIRGGDANGGTFVGEEVVGGVGYRDRSFLGNIHLGTQIEGNDKVSNDVDEGTVHAKHSIKSEGNYSSWFGPYLEAGDVTPEFAPGTTNLVIGGQAISRFVNAERFGGGYTAFSSRALPGAARPYKLIVGRDAQPLLWQAMQTNGLAAEPYGHRLEFRPEFDAWQIASEAFAPTGLGSDRWELRFKSSAVTAQIGTFFPGPHLSPLPEVGVSMCHDGIDNDGDGKIDAADTGCSP